MIKQLRSELDTVSFPCILLSIIHNYPCSFHAQNISTHCDPIAVQRADLGVASFWFLQQSLKVIIASLPLSLAQALKKQEESAAAVVTAQDWNQSKSALIYAVDLNARIYVF